MTAGPESGAPESGAVDLYWLPLGAGGWFVRSSGRVYERLAATLAHRPPLELYHAALEVTTSAGRFAVELTPIPSRTGPDRGVVGEGPVGSARLRRWRPFRYELHGWRGGEIPDIRAAVESPRRVARSEAQARRVLDLLPSVPLLTWGRDERHLGEMWNSNSVIAWLLARADLDPSAIGPPHGGRAPGWDAGLAGSAQPSLTTSPGSGRPAGSRGRVTSLRPPATSTNARTESGG